MALKLTPRLNTISTVTNRPTIPIMRWGKFEGKTFQQIPEEYLHTLLQSSENLAKEIRQYLGLPTKELTSHCFKRLVWKRLEELRKDSGINPELKTEVLTLLQRIMVQIE